MKTTRLIRALRGALTLPVLLGVPLLAQGVPAPIYRIDGAAEQVVITTTYREPVPQLLLVAADRESVTIEGVEFLSNGAVVGFVPKARTAEWVLPFPSPVLTIYDVHVQALVLDHGRLVGGPIVPTRYVFEVDAFLPVEHKAPLTEVAMGLERADVGDYWFVAEFVARSDGYAIYDAAVVRHAEVTDVYLALKTPGPGEGFLDIMEELQIVVDLGAEPGAQVRVFAFADPAPFSAALNRYQAFELWEVSSVGGDR